MSLNSTWNAAELAQMLGITDRHVKRLASEGAIPRRSPGRYGPEAVTAYCEYIRSEARQGGPDYKAERTRKVKEEADRLEMENEVRRGDLLPRADVDAAVIGAFSRVRARFLGVPPKVAPLVAAIIDPAECEAVVRQVVHDCLQELSQTTVEDMAG